MSQQHTLLFLQFRKDEPMTRTYLDFNTIDDCCRGLCLIFEQHLRREQHLEDKESVDYTFSQLMEYIDQIGDLTCMVYNDT